MLDFRRIPDHLSRRDKRDEAKADNGSKAELKTDFKGHWKENEKASADAGGIVVRTHHANQQSVQVADSYYYELRNSGKHSMSIELQLRLKDNYHENSRR